MVFDGDGNLLMNLGILPMVGGGPAIGRGRPANFVHVVFDNGVYGSTGGQLSPSRGVGLAAVAAACGYARAESVDSAAGVESALRGAIQADGRASSSSASTPRSATRHASPTSPRRSATVSVAP